jgi:ATP-binding cassette subfamily C protein CydC
MLNLWRALGRPERPRLRLALLLAALAAALSVGLLALSGWFIAASALAGLGGAAWSFNHLYPSAGIRAAAVGRVASRYAEQIVGHAATLHLSARLRPALFRAMAHARPGVAPLSAARQAQLIEEVDAAEAGFLRLWLPGIAVVAGVGLTFLLALAVDPLGAAATAGACAALLWDLVRRSRGIERATAALSEAEAEQRRSIGDFVDGARALECLDALPVAGAAFLTDSAAAWDQRERIDARARRWGLLPTAAAGIFAALALARAQQIGADLPMALAVALAGVAAFQAAGGLAALGPLWPRSTRAAATLSATLGAQPASIEPETSAVPAAALPLVVRGLYLQPGGPETRRGPIDFTLSAGEVLLLTGPSGVGKTSLLETLVRLRAPAAGGIWYDGLAADRLRGAAVRCTVALAPQTPQFAEGTLAEALRLANPTAVRRRWMLPCGEPRYRS